MTEYRRIRGREVWHSNPDCQHYDLRRIEDYVIRFEKPTSGEFCNECLAKNRRRDDN